ncbi:unnamed protein product [Amoebophrya sp. A25]|nr:unnamed protein product [Amoebophrya sp. A25]|eukprot:GSA25T00017869001.1
MNKMSRSSGSFFGSGRSFYFVFLRLPLLAFIGVTPVTAFCSGVTDEFGYIRVDNGDDFILYGYSGEAGRDHGRGHVQLKSREHCVTKDSWATGRIRSKRPLSNWRSETRSTGYRSTMTTFYCYMDSSVPAAEYVRDCTAEELSEAKERIENAKRLARLDTIYLWCFLLGLLAFVIGTVWIVHCCSQRNGKCGGSKDKGAYDLSTVSSDEEHDLEQGEYEQNVDAEHQRENDEISSRRTV